MTVDSSFLDLGSSIVGNLSCDETTVAWSSSSNPDPKHLFLDRIFSSPVESPQASPIAQAVHGGELGVDISLAGNWVVFQEYQQAGESSGTNFWFIRAVELSTKRAFDIAGSHEDPSRLELPSVSVSNDTVVWDELVAPSRKVLKLYNLRTRQVTTLDLPPAMYPVRPQLRGTDLIFLDNATDPNRSHEDFISRGGHLMRLDLTDGRLVQLDSAPDARQPRVGGSFVAWHGTVPDPDHPNSPSTVFDVQLSPIDGGKSRIVASLGYRSAVSNSYLVWYNDRLPGTFAFSLTTELTRNLHIRALETMAPTYALCGNTLFYAPLDSTTVHSIRALHLTG